MGLRQDIMAAMTSEEVENLYKSGLKYEYASPKTRRAWARSVSVRLKQLGLLESQPVAPVATKPQQVNRSKPKNAKNK